MAEIGRTIVILLGLLLFWPCPSPASPAALLNRAAALLTAGQPAEALTLLHEAERTLPEPRLAAGLLGEGYLRLGWQHLTRGDEVAARDAFDRARHYLPDDPRPLQGTALTWLHAGQPAAAVGPLQEALVLSGEQAELLLLLGRAYYAQGELAQAEAAWEQAAGGGAAEAAPLLAKVRRERQAEQGMSRDLAGRFTLAYTPGVSQALADAVLVVLQDAYNDLGRALGFYPDVDIPVLLYSREDFAAVTRSPAWAGAVYDGKIRVPLGGVAHMTPILRGLLYHEYAHVLVRFLGKGRIPVWLNEGLAELAEVRQTDQPEAVPDVSALPPAALGRPFTELPAELVPVAYALSRVRVGRMVAACGWPALGELMRQLGAGLGWEAAVAEAYAPCGYDWPRLQAVLAGP
jgi:tetratricopeptide (TPR) repeat protein